MVLGVKVVGTIRYSKITLFPGRTPKHLRYLYQGFYRSRRVPTSSFFDIYCQVKLIFYEDRFLENIELNKYIYH